MKTQSIREAQQLAADFGALVRAKDRPGLATWFERADASSHTRDPLLRDGAATRSRCRRGGHHVGVEQRPDRGPGQPPQSPEAPDVWPRQARLAARSASSMPPDDLHRKVSQSPFRVDKHTPVVTSLTAFCMVCSGAYRPGVSVPLPGSQPGRPVLEDVIGRQMTERHRRGVRSVSRLQRTQGTPIGECTCAAGGPVPVGGGARAHYRDRAVRDLIQRLADVDRQRAIRSLILRGTTETIRIGPVSSCTHLVETEPRPARHRAIPTRSPLLAEAFARPGSL